MKSQDKDVSRINNAALKRPRVVPSSKLTLRDRLSQLSIKDAIRYLGPQGERLIAKNANKWVFDIPVDIYLGSDLFRLTFPTHEKGQKKIIVTITLMAEARNRLHIHCTACGGGCEHIGAAFSLILEQKMELGLSAAPPEPSEPMENLDEQNLIERALAFRIERAKTEKMTIRSSDPARPWTNYLTTNHLSGKTYLVTLRGLDPGDSWCDCPDFRTNTLGTCKHIIKVCARVKRRFESRQLQKPHRPRELELRLHYGAEVELRWVVPVSLDEAISAMIQPDQPISSENIHGLMKKIQRLKKMEQDVFIHPDAEEFIQQRMIQDRLMGMAQEIRTDPANNTLRKDLLKIPLLPYQLDGIAFAASAGRAILADEMGLGKTIQAVGVAEFLAREAGIKKVLIVCPASLKSQWRSEIERFCDRGIQLINGSLAERDRQYSNEQFFTVCNYEQVLRDFLSIERASWDMIILDEGQRIKNWESKTSRVIKSLRSRFALVLSGTPLENKLDDLYSIVQFVDDRRLGPGFRFFHRHRVVDENGRVTGYKNLAELREALKPVLLRRTRESVKLELPPRTVEFIRIPPTEEQAVMHAAHMNVVVTITRKKFLTEMDLLRLQKALLMCRMSANSTVLVDKVEPGYSTKLQHLDELIERIFEEPGRKVVLFSEWTGMLNLIEPILRRHLLDFVRLDGGVPQKMRQQLVNRFQNEPDCAVFLTTNAGSTGLNLQAADTVINVDLPWNPAVLEQRIARAHRMGQLRPVQVYNLVTENTLEENLLGTIAAKKDLALAALDTESAVDDVNLVSNMDELKKRLEILLGSKPEAPLDQSQERAARKQEGIISAGSAGILVGADRERIALAGGELFGAALNFLSQLAPAREVNSAPPSGLVEQLRTGLGALIQDQPTGKPCLTIPLPSRDMVDHFAQVLAKLITAGQVPQSAAKP